MSLEATAYFARSDTTFHGNARGRRSYRVFTPRFITVASGPLAPDDDTAKVLGTCLDELAKGGIHAFARLPGNFAVVVWDRQARVLWAARDVFGAVPLYYQLLPNRLRLATDLDRFGASDFDREFIAEFIATGGASPTRTVRRGVLPVPAAHALVCKDGQVRLERYWSLEDHQPASSADPNDLAQEFRRLLECAVRRCTSSTLERGPTSPED